MFLKDPGAAVEGTVIRQSLKAEKNTTKKLDIWEERSRSPVSPRGGGPARSPRKGTQESTEKEEPQAPPKVDKPTLTYWEIPGRAESVRLLLEVAGEDYAYNPIRYPAGDHWKEYRTTYADGLTFGQIPRYQEPGGLDLVQSHSILRHIARKYGFNGANERETSKIDVMYEGVQDFLAAHGRAFYATREKEKALATFINDAAPSWLGYFSKVLEKSGGDYLVGSKLSYADTTLFIALKRTSEMEGGKDVIDKFPAVAAFFTRLANHPNIKAFYDSNPYSFKW